MKCEGEFVFKSITKREAGNFTNDKGEQVIYPEAYILKVDEITEDGEINERKFKIGEKNQSLISKLQEVKSYQPIKLSFIVGFYNNQVRVVPFDLLNVLEEVE